MHLSGLLVAVTILIALSFDFINGFHDAANSIATVVSTRVLSPRLAVIWAAFFNFIAAFVFGTAVAKTIAGGLVDPHQATQYVILSALTGANVPGDGGAFRNNVSVDQLMAEVQGVSTRFSSLEMAVEGVSLAWSRDGIQIPAERNTQQIFNMLFGVEKDGKETIRRRLSRRGQQLHLR